MQLNLPGRIGLVLLAVLALVALAGPWLAPYDPDRLVAAPFARPSRAHPLGANDIGQDLLSQLIAGARTSLSVGLSAGALATAIGAAAGLSAGLAGGAADFLVMRMVDILLALPYLPLMIVLAVFLGPRAETQVLIMAAVMWPRTSRVLRAQVLSLAGRGQVETARVMGAGRAHLLMRHIVPLVFPLIVPELVRTTGSAIMTETSLAFLGLGDPVHRSWGSILFYANARAAFLTDAWIWWVVPPGLGVGLTVLSLGLIGFSLEERARPRLRASAFAGRVAAANARLTRRLRAAPAERRRGETPTGGGAAGAVAIGDGRAIEDRPDRLLDVENLAVTYSTVGRAIAESDAGAGVAALRGVTLSVRAGETVGLVGESGSGKTTLATGILALHGPAARVVTGRILLAGCDVVTADNAVLRGLRGTEAALVPQNSMNALNPVHRALAQVVEAIEAHEGRRRRPRGLRREARRRAEALLAEVGLPADRWHSYPSELSGGMRQRVVLAIALANNPRLLIADEPTSGLDLLLQAELVALLRRLRTRSNMGVLLVSHDLGLAAAVADRLVVMQDGRVVEDGITSRVVGQPAHAHSIQLVASVARTAGALQGAGRTFAGDRPSEPDVLRANRVTVTFCAGRRREVFDAVHDVSFSIAEREWVALIGPSGAGKSTLARAIVGLLRPSSGDVRLLDASDAQGHAGGPAPPRFHLVLQDPYDALPPGMRVADVIAEPLRINHVPRGKWAAVTERALEEVSLAPGLAYARRYPHELSGGERQRVALARALVVPPRLLVADEPTSLLDASHRLELLDLMRRLTDAAGVACLYITHDIALAAAFADRLLVIDRGRLVESGRAADVVSAPRHPTTAALVAAARKMTDFGTGFEARR